METSHPHGGKEKRDLESLHERLDVLGAQIGYLVERQQKIEELVTEMTPIARDMLTTAAAHLGDLEKRGYFDFAREAMAVGERVVEGFSPDDVRRLGGAIVGILETVRAMTQPEVLRVAGEAAKVLENAESAEPMGLLGMVRATRDDDVQKGMSVMMELMRHVGRAAVVVQTERKASPMSQKRARLDAVTGARRKGALGVERTPRVRAAAAPVAAAAMPPPAACAVPSAGPAAVATVLDGVGFAADGHLADPATWTRELGEKIAAVQGVTLGEAHWKVLEFARADFLATHTSPNIRRLTQGAGVTTKDLYTLFPKAPARTVAKVAGIPKPAGCI